MVMPPFLPPTGGPPPMGPMGPMGPAPAPMGPPAPPNPLLAIAALVAQAQDDLAPEPEAPYRITFPRAPKPTKAVISTLAQQDQSDFQAYVDAVAHTRARLAGRTSAVFRIDLPEVKARLIEPFQLSALQDEFTNMKNWGSGNKARFTAPLRLPSHRVIAQMKQDFCHFLHMEEKTQHLDAFGEDFDLALWDMFLGTGRLAGIDLIDPHDPDCPYIMQLLDPTTVFPTWEGPKQALARCTIVREDALLGNVLGRYDPDGELREQLYGKERSATLAGAAVKLPGDIDGRYGPNSQGKLVEWWDRDWRGILWNDEWILEPEEHELGEVPITYVLGPVGGSSVMAGAPLQRLEEVQDGTVAWVTGGGTRDAGNAAIGLPFTWFSHVSHDQEEAVMTRLFNDIAISNKRPKYIKEGPVPSDKDSLRWSRKPNAVNWLANGEDIGWEPTSPDPNTLMPVLQGFSQGRMTNRIPLAAFGQAPAQTSGYAVENMQEAGRERAAGFVQGVANFLRLRSEKRLRFWEQHGHYLGDPNSPGIVLPFRYPQEGQEDLFELTPEHLQQAGCRMEVKLTNLRLANLGNLGNAVNQWMGMELMSRDKALELREEDDIEGEKARIEVDKLEKDPLLTLPRLLKRLVREGEMDTAEFVAQLYRESRMMKDMEQAAMGGGPQGMQPGGGPPQLGPGGPGPSPANVPGLSLPGLGMPPGQQGGRPPQPPTGPQQPSLPGM